MRFWAHYIFLFTSLIIICKFPSSYCWESYELDLFDLVEEIGQNFYDFLGVKQNSDQNEIKKAYRKMSLLWHPDKNSDPQAELKFRQIVSIYEVLKDDAKRARYDEILVNGLPDWRQPIFYFRRVRKLNMTELTIALSIIISIGHYFVMWAQYFERKLTLDRMEDVKKKLDKQKQKKKKAATEWDEIDACLQDCYNKLPSPRLTQTLPCRVAVWFFKSACKLPWYLKEALVSRPKPVEVENELEETEEEINNRKRAQRANESSRLHLNLNPKKIEQVQSVAPVLNYATSAPNENGELDDEAKKQATEANSDREWTNKQKNDLIKAIARFPAGYVNRWTKIAEAVGRSANDCIEMEKQMKKSINSSTHSSLNSTSWNANIKRTVNISEEPTISDSNYLGANVAQQQEDKNNSDSSWSQEQQKCLEKALKEISKDASNRWDLIAEKVPNKTKNDCIKRYKEICASLKTKTS